MLKKKRPTWLAAVLIVSVIPAMALLKTTVFSNNKSVLAADNSTKYDIIADLGEGGRFESGDFSKMPNGKWISKYLPSKNPVPIPKPVKDGQVFEGWLVGNDRTPKPDYAIPPWSRENINLTAKWRSKENILLPGPQFNKAVKNISYNIDEIHFLKGTPNPDGVDLSEAQDGSIMGYMDNYGNLIIESEEQIYANPNCQDLFNDVRDIRTILFTNFNTSKVINMSGMFKENVGLHTADFSKFNTSEVTDMCDMFYNTDFRDLDLTSFNTSKVTNMSGMFMGCSFLQVLNVSSFDTSKVTNMCSMFDGCNDLLRLNISNFNTSQVTNMEHMFAECRSLESLNLNSFNTSKVTNMSGMFFRCETLPDLNLSNFNTSQVTDMDYMFYLCTSLLDLDLSNFNTSKVTNMQCMFSRCWHIETINLSKFDTSKVVNTANMFEECGGLSGEITIANPNAVNYSSMFSGCSSDANAKFIVKYTDNATKTIAQKMVNTKNPGDHVYLWEGPNFLLDGPTFNSKIKNFSGRHKITTIIFENSLPSNATAYEYFDASLKQDGSIIAYTTRDSILRIASNNLIYANQDCSEMFAGLSGIENIDLRNLDTSLVINMVAMFNLCTKLKTIDISNLDTSSVTNMGYMFRFCVELRELNFSNFDTSNVVNMSNMFDTCMGVTRLDLTSFNTSKVTNMSYMFWGCTYLTDLDVTSFDTSQVTDMQWMFCCCEKLSYVDLSSFNFSKVNNFSSIFTSCTTLRGINTVIPIRNNANCDSMFKQAYEISTEIIIASQNIKFSETFASTRRPITISYIDDTTKYIASNLSENLNDNLYLGKKVTIPAGKAKSFNQSPHKLYNTSSTTPHTITLNNGTAAQYPKQVFTVQNNTMPQLSIPELNPRYAGHFGGYYYDPQFTKPVKAGDIITKDLTIYARW